MKNLFLLIAGISGALVVAIGALGAHSLKPYLPPDALVSYETAVRYQFYHTLALLFIACGSNITTVNYWAPQVGYLWRE